MAETIKVGVIGVGQIGKRHVASYAEMPDVEIVALADVDEAEVQRVAAQHGVKQKFSKFRDLLVLPEIQARVDRCIAAYISDSRSPRRIEEF